MRVITASEEVASLVDQGATVDKELKNLTYQDKGFKKKITDYAEGEWEGGEKSLRIEGQGTGTSFK